MTCVVDKVMITQVTKRDGEMEKWNEKMIIKLNNLRRSEENYNLILGSKFCTILNRVNINKNEKKGLGNF